jgi:hypothetical protein
MGLRTEQRATPGLETMTTREKTEARPQRIARVNP